jgi:DNA mismatch repair ATPase MutS
MKILNNNKIYNINDILKKNDNDLTFDERLFILNYNLDNNYIETLLSSLLIYNSYNKIEINDYVYNDAELFNNFDNNIDTLFNKINLCNTTYGKYILINTLKNPIKDITILKKRQDAIKFIKTN